MNKKFDFIFLVITLVITSCSDSQYGSTSIVKGIVREKHSMWHVLALSCVEDSTIWFEKSVSPGLYYAVNVNDTVQFKSIGNNSFFKLYPELKE